MPLKVIEEFSVSRLQILDEQGNVDDKLEPEIAPDELLRIYRAMVFAREADQRMLKMQRQGRIGTFGPSTGQEACAIGAAAAMAESDWMVGAFRELGHRVVFLCFFFITCFCHVSITIHIISFFLHFYRSRYAFLPERDDLSLTLGIVYYDI